LPTPTFGVYTLNPHAHILPQPPQIIAPTQHFRDNFADFSAIFHSPPLLPSAICDVCQNIPLEQLHSEDVQGFPDQASITCLRDSAKRCSLCRIILLAIVYQRDEIDSNHKGEPKNEDIARIKQWLSKTEPALSRLDFSCLNSQTVSSNLTSFFLLTRSV
jgi:hypothetical protein